MNKPKMIIFDYGQTLFNEDDFDGIKGTKAVLEKCVKNHNNISAEEINNFARQMNKDFGRYNKEANHLYQFEIHEHQVQKYLYEYFGIEVMVSNLELETVFWNAASPCKPTDNIEEFLDFLNKNDIRTSVISNISFSGEALINRINTFLPNNKFEFIMATSEYIYRKPHKRIYELALRKSNLDPREVWYCGDNAICDVDGAKLSGLTPIWYKGALKNNDLAPKEEYTIVNDWMELMELLMLKYFL